MPASESLSRNSASVVRRQPGMSAARKFTWMKLGPPTMLDMGTKQHKTFCPSCGKTTNHVTRYQKDDDGGPLIANVRCAEHTESVPNN